MFRIVLTLLGRLVLIGAWVVALAGLGLLVVEESGILTEGVRKAVAWRLGPLGEELSIERVSLRWFEPGIVLEGVSLRSPPSARDRTGEELLRLRSVHFALHADWQRRLPLRRLRIEGGRIRISDRLLDGLNRFASSLRAEGDEPTPSFKPPPFDISNFEVELELPDESVLEIGTVNLRARPEPDGSFRITGQLVPSLSGAVPEPVDVWVEGRQWESGVELQATAIGVPLATTNFRIPAYLG